MYYHYYRFFFFFFFSKCVNDNNIQDYVSSLNIFPSQVTSKVKRYGGWPNTVSITTSSFGQNGQLVWEGEQRQLYRKYGWPAQKGIKAALGKLKASEESKENPEESKESPEESKE
mmetsp:Transcript_19076/g.34104  ORF Transcript_19076/g.34104 Transcript_19076/m.34104 type:complete len:115 (+) Transcript_19076:239-583(+)